MRKYVDRIFIQKLTQCYYNRRKNHVSGCSCYHYNMNEFHYWQDRIFKKLIAECKQFRWDEAELDWVCGEMERNNSMLDPTHFTENPFAFIVHAQNCYLLSQ